MGAAISSDDRRNIEIASLLAQAQSYFQRMKVILTNKDISIKPESVFQCYVEPIVMYNEGLDSLITNTKEASSDTYGS